MRLFKLAVVLLVLGISAIAGAQDRVIAVAKIPFQFTAHSQVFDAGDYEVRQIGAQTVRLQDVNSRIGVTLLGSQTIGVGAPVTILFRVNTGQYFLASVSAQSFQIKIRKSRLEVESAATRKPRTVEVIALR
jgi:hypothetical protein